MWLVAWSINGAFRTRSIVNFGAPCECFTVAANRCRVHSCTVHPWCMNAPYITFDIARGLGLPGIDAGLRSMQLTRQG